MALGAALVEPLVWYAYYWVALFVLEERLWRIVSAAPLRVLRRSWFATWAYAPLHAVALALFGTRCRQRAAALVRVPRGPGCRGRLRSDAWGLYDDNDAQWRKFRSALPLLAAAAAAAPPRPRVRRALPRRPRVRRGRPRVARALRPRVVRRVPRRGARAAAARAARGLGARAARAGARSGPGALRRRMTWAYVASAPRLDAHGGLAPLADALPFLALRLASARRSAPEGRPATFRDVVAYATYAPLYLAGPVATYGDLSSARRRRASRPTRRGRRSRASTSARARRRTHVYALAASGAYGALPPGAAAAFAFLFINVLWLKFAFLWRCFRCWALADGRRAPENMRRFVCDNFTIAGFWRGWHASFNGWLRAYNLAALRRAAYDLEHSALETLRAVAVVLYEKRLASGRAPADFRLRDDHACVAMTLTRRKNGRKCLRALGLQRIDGVWRETNRADRAPRLGGEVVAVGAAAEARPEDEDAAEARDMARVASARQRPARCARGVAPRRPPAQAAWFGAVVDEVDHLLYRYRRWRAARPSSQGARARVAQRRVHAGFRERKRSAATPATTTASARARAAPRPERRPGRGQLAHVRKKAPGPLKGFDAPSEANGERCCVYFDAAKKRWCLGPAPGLDGRRLRLLAGDAAGAPRGTRSRRTRATPAAASSSSRPGPSHASTSATRPGPPEEDGSPNALPVVVAEDRVAGCDDVAAVWVGATHKTYVPRAALAPLPHGEALAFLVESDGAGGALARAPPGGKPAAPRATPKKSAAAEVLATVGAAAAFGAAAKPKKAPAGARETVMPDGDGDDDGDDDDDGDGDKDDGDGEKPAEAPEPAAAAPKAKTASTKRRATEDDDGDSVVDAKEWTYKTDQERRVEREDGVLCDEEPMDVARWTALAKALLGERGGGAFSHVFDCDTLDAGGKAGWRSRVAPELLGVQFDGANFTVVHLPDEGVTDPHAVVSHDPRLEDHVVWVARDNVSPTALERRAKNRDRAFGDVDPWFGQQRLDDDELAFGTAANAADGARHAERDRHKKPASKRGPGKADYDAAATGAAPDALQVWDLRRGAVPETLRVVTRPARADAVADGDDDDEPEPVAVDAAPLLRMQKDRSSCLVLPPKHWLELAPTDVPTNNGWVRGLNDYTVVVDVKFEKPLEAAFAALQPQARQGGGACHFLPPAAPAPPAGVAWRALATRRRRARATLRARRWNRVVIAVEAQWEKGRKVKVYVNGAPSFEGYWNATGARADKDNVPLAKKQKRGKAKKDRLRGLATGSRREDWRREAPAADPARARPSASSTSGARPEAEATYTVAVVCAHAHLLGFHESTLCATATACKERFRTAKSFGGVPAARATCPVFWAAALSASRVPQPSSEVYKDKTGKKPDPDEEKKRRGVALGALYDWLLPWLAGRPFGRGPPAGATVDDFRTPQRSGAHDYRTVLHSLAFVARRSGLGPADSKQLMLALKMQLLAFAEHDLSFLESIEDADVKLLDNHGAGVAHSAAKLATRPDRSGSMGPDELEAVRSAVRRLDDKVRSLPRSGREDAGPEPLLLDASHRARRQVAPYHGLDRLLRRGSVDKFAGAAMSSPRYVPVDFLAVRARASTLDEALDAMRWADRVCTLTSVQSDRVKRSGFLKHALLTHVFTRVLPVPRPRGALADRARPCLWADEDILYGQQLDGLILLQRLVEHFAAAAFSINSTRAADGSRTVVPAVAAAVADALARRAALDEPSYLSLTLSGAAGRSLGFGISAGPLALQSATIEARDPHLSVARTSVLDYFAAQAGLEKTMCWDMGQSRAAANLDGMLRSLCDELAWNPSPSILPHYATAPNLLLAKNCPEWACYRDVAFYFKYFMNTSAAAFPAAPASDDAYTQRMAHLSWSYDEAQHRFVVAAFSKSLACASSSAARFPSNAAPGPYCAPHAVATEDDVLHVKQLPSFGDALGQHDSELLLSYLTVPYIRLPLVLRFFSTEDRVHALRTAACQGILDAVLFEPGRYLEAGLGDRAPRSAPCGDDETLLLATPYGHLLNELQRSPKTTCDAVVALLKHALDLDAGTVRATTVPIIQYLARTCARVDAYLDFVLAYDADADPLNPLRDFALPAAHRSVIEAASKELRRLLRGPVHCMVEAWISELAAECADGGDKTLVDANARLIANLEAHNLVVFRTATSAADMTEDVASTVACAMTYLQTRHSWNRVALDVPETEVFGAYQDLRRPLLERLTSTTGKERADVCEAILRVTAGSGQRLVAGADDVAPRKWAAVAEPKHLRPGYVSARFTLSPTPGAPGDEPIEYVDRRDDRGRKGDAHRVMLDLQAGLLTVGTMHLRALSAAHAAHPDVVATVGTQAVQAATVSSATNREWLRLVSSSLELQIWTTPDARPLAPHPPGLLREYAPDALEKDEYWLLPLVEPLRLAYFNDPRDPVHLWMAEDPLDASATVARLVANRPEAGGCWREIYAFRDHAVVHVYDVFSHARRFHRALVHTTDTRFTLKEMQPELPPPCGAGDPFESLGPNEATSVAVMRDHDHAGNLSLTRETYVPTRLLAGQLPEALLDAYEWWQDEGDDLVGYPPSTRGDAAAGGAAAGRDGPRAAAGRGRAATAGPRPAATEAEAFVVRVALKRELPLLAAALPWLGATVRRVPLALARRAARAARAACSRASALPTPKALVELPPIESRAAGADHGERTPYAMAVAAIAKLVERHAPEHVVAAVGALAPESRFETVGSLCAAVDAALPAGSGGDVAEHRLLNLLLAKEGSELHSVARTLSRVDNLSSILAWTAATTRDEPDAEPTYAISVVELPRLKLSFAERGGKLYSLDHAQLAISNVSNAMTKSLIRGLPHSLLLANANDELTVLLPSVRVTRPALGVFSTALVVDRTNAPVGAGRRAWGAALKDGFYYLYDAHVSLGYLICPTLAASLYLLLLRFLSRDYARCFQLARAVGVDYELSEECANILAAFAAGNDDDHPDAISCRLRVTIVLADAGATVPWDVASQCAKLCGNQIFNPTSISLVDFHTGAKLVEKLSRVSASCRLSREEELRLLKRFAVVDASKHSVAERTAIRNRREHLAALASGRASPTFAASLSPKYVHGGDWVARVASNTRPVLQARPEFAAGVQLFASRDADPTIYGVQAVDELFALLQAKANGSPEDVLGSTHGRGFLYLYSLLAGGASVDVFGGGSASWSTAAATSTRSSYSRGATSWDLDFDDYDADLDAWDDRRWRRPTRAPATPAGRSWAGLAMFALENVAGPSPVASILATLASYPELVPGLPEWRKPSAGGAKTKGRGRAVGDSTKRVFSGRDPSVAALFDEILEVLPPKLRETLAAAPDPPTWTVGDAKHEVSLSSIPRDRQHGPGHDDRQPPSHESALTTIAEHIPHCRCGPDVGWARPDVSDHAASPSTRLRAVDAPFVAKIAAELEASERREAANAALLERRKVLSAAHVRKALDDAPLFRKARRMDVDGATPTDFRWFDDEALDAAAADHLEAVAAGGRFRDGSVVAVFAGAAWDPESRLAVGALKTLHEKLRREGGDGSFEIIFASLDQSEAEMAEFFVADHGDWLCLKYGDKAAADRLFGLWKPGGAPALLLLDATDGSVLCEDGFAALRKDPTAEKFPWCDRKRFSLASLRNQRALGLVDDGDGDRATIRAPPTAQAVLRAFRKRSLACHPDRLPADDGSRLVRARLVAAKAQFERLSLAKENLLHEIEARASTWAGGRGGADAGGADLSRDDARRRGRALAGGVDVARYVARETRAVAAAGALPFARRAASTRGRVAKRCSLAPTTTRVQREARRDERVPSLRCLDDRALAGICGGDDAVGGVHRDHALREVGQLVADLEELKSADLVFMARARRLARFAANRLDAGDGDGDEAMGRGPRDVAQAAHALRRRAGAEATVDEEFLYSCLLSSEGAADVRRINPFLGDATRVLDLATALMLHASRVGANNRCLTAAGELRALLRGAGSAAGSDADRLRERHALRLKSEALAGLLSARRHFADADGDGWTYDPRFLLTEFAWNIVLREKQVALVRDIAAAVGDASRVSAVVKQMLMGGGKTTVVAPLLALLLGADARALVALVVPPALLEFSRANLRATFNAVIHKPVYTLEIDRNTTVTAETIAKLDHCRKSRGVVIATPSTVKAAHLKYVECCELLTDARRVAGAGSAAGGPCENAVDLAAVEAHASELRRLLGLFKGGVAIVDEVDLVLHPLKSELNFPIGDKVPLDFSPERWQLAIHMLDAVFSYETGASSVGFDESVLARKVLGDLRRAIDDGFRRRALQRSPHLTLLSLSYYHDTLKPILAEWAVFWLMKSHVGGVTREDTLRFLVEGASEAGPNADVARRINDRSTIDAAHAQMLTLARDWIQSFLPHCLSKIDRVSFGVLDATDLQRALAQDPRMPLSRRVLAIPFVGKDTPSRSSEFAHPDVIIGLTILAYRYSGMPYSAVERVVSALLASFEKELGPFRRRKSSLLFEHWISAAGGALKTSDTASSMICETGDDVRRAVERLVNDEECVPLRLLRRSNSGQMNKIYKLLRRSPHCVHHFLESFVFPEHMRHQSTKLSASGQEIGGDVLFPRRVGFSGTPSDLIPAELGRCGYELGSDGYMIECLTRADVSAHVNVADDWTVDSLLRDVARSEAPRLNALIDVGALVTGVSNEQVARRLLDLGLAPCDGVVFLDPETDKKMILVRATKRVVALETSGIPPHRRFAFYDNIHTTGMDIHHSATAVAAVTLGKDSNFRDYAQGAFRMRGVAKGQRLVTLLIPELRDLVRRDLALARIPCPPQLGGDAPGEAGDLSPVGVAVVAWLTLQSMKGERLQFNQLSVQNALNVPRKNAFAALLGAALASGSGQRLTLSAPSVTGSTRRATADAATEATITRTKGFVVTAIRVDHDAPFGGGRGFVQIYDRHPSKTFFLPLRSPDGALLWTCDDAAFEAAADAHASNPTFAADVRAAVGVYLEPLDFAVADRVAPPAPLAETLARSVEDHAKFVASPEDRDRCARWVDALRSMPVKAEECELAREMVQEMEEEREKQQEQEQERAVEVEKYVDCAYRRDGEKPSSWPLDRLRHRDLCRQFYPLSDFRLFARRPLEFPAFVLSSDNYFRRDWIGERRLKNVVVTAEWIPDVGALAPALHGGARTTGRYASAARILAGAGAVADDDVAELSRLAAHAARDDALAAARAMGGGALAADGFEALATSGRLEPYEDGRFVVAVSLAEAETLRRVLHVRQGRALLDGSRCALALSLNDDTVLDASTDFAPAAAPFSRDASRACLSFFDSNAYHGERDLNVLVRSLGWRNAPSARRRWFTQVAACRRRFSRPWREQPVAAVFQLSDAGSMTLLRCLSAGLRRALERAGVHLFDAFHEAWDASGNGILSPKEVVAALRACGLGGAASLDDVLDFVDRADGDGDGNLSYYELVDALRDPEEAPDDDGDDDRDAAARADKALAARRAPRAARRGRGRRRRAARARARRLDAEAAERDADAREEERVRLAVERAEGEQDARFGRRSNPSVDASKPGGEATFSFATGRHVRGARVRGTTAFLERAGAIELAASGGGPLRCGRADQRSEVMRVLRATPGLCGPEEDLTYLVPSVDRLLDAAAQANSEAQLWTQVEECRQQLGAAPEDQGRGRGRVGGGAVRPEGVRLRDVARGVVGVDGGRRGPRPRARRVLLAAPGPPAGETFTPRSEKATRADVARFEKVGGKALEGKTITVTDGPGRWRQRRLVGVVLTCYGNAKVVKVAWLPGRDRTDVVDLGCAAAQFVVEAREGGLHDDGRLVEIAHAASRTVVIVSETFGRVTARDGEWAYVDAGAVAKLARQIRRRFVVVADAVWKERRPWARNLPAVRFKVSTKLVPSDLADELAHVVGEIHVVRRRDARGGLPAATATVAVAGEVVATAEIPGARPRARGVSFIASPCDEGRVAGLAYAAGPHGLGYYLEHERAADAARAREVLTEYCGTRAHVDAAIYVSNPLRGARGGAEPGARAGRARQRFEFALNGEPSAKCVVAVARTATLGDLKAKLELATGVPAASQVLLAPGDSETLMAKLSESQREAFEALDALIGETEKHVEGWVEKVAEALGRTIKAYEDCGAVAEDDAATLVALGLGDADEATEIQVLPRPESILEPLTQIIVKQPVPGGGAAAPVAAAPDRDDLRPEAQALGARRRHRARAAAPHLRREGVRGQRDAPGPRHLPELRPRGRGVGDEATARPFAEPVDACVRVRVGPRSEKGKATSRPLLGAAPPGARADDAPPLLAVGDSASPGARRASSPADSVRGAKVQDAITDKGDFTHVHLADGDTCWGWTEVWLVVDAGPHDEARTRRPTPTARAHARAAPRTTTGRGRSSRSTGPRACPRASRSSAPAAPRPSPTSTSWCYGRALSGREVLGVHARARARADLARAEGADDGDDVVGSEECHTPEWRVEEVLAGAAGAPRSRGVTLAARRACTSALAVLGRRLAFFVSDDASKEALVAAGLPELVAARTPLEPDEATGVSPELVLAASRARAFAAHAGGKKFERLGLSARSDGKSTILYLLTAETASALARRVKGDAADASKKRKASTLTTPRPARGAGVASPKLRWAPATAAALASPPSHAKWRLTGLGAVACQAYPDLVLGADDAGAPRCCRRRRRAGDGVKPTDEASAAEAAQAAAEKKKIRIGASVMIKETAWGGSNASKAYGRVTDVDGDGSLRVDVVDWGEVVVAPEDATLLSNAAARAGAGDGPKKAKFAYTKGEAIFSGVQRNVPLAFLDDDAGGWTRHYCAPYARPTHADDLRSIPEDATYVLVGAVKAGAQSLALAAIGERDVVVGPANPLARPPDIDVDWSDELGAEEEPARSSNGAYWYLREGLSFGFAAEQHVVLAAADVCSRGTEPGALRLSWHLEGSGGHRCGKEFSLDDSRAWLKVVYYTTKTPSRPRPLFTSAALERLGVETYDGLCEDYSYEVHEDDSLDDGPVSRAYSACLEVFLRQLCGRAWESLDASWKATESRKQPGEFYFADAVSGQSLWSGAAVGVLRACHVWRVLADEADRRRALGDDDEFGSTLAAAAADASRYVGGSDDLRALRLEPAVFDSSASLAEGGAAAALLKVGAKVAFYPDHEGEGHHRRRNPRGATVTKLDAQDNCVQLKYAGSATTWVPLDALGVDELPKLGFAAKALDRVPPRAARSRTRSRTRARAARRGPSAAPAPGAAPSAWRRRRQRLGGAAAWLDARVVAVDGDRLRVRYRAHGPSRDAWVDRGSGGVAPAASSVGAWRGPRRRGRRRRGPRGRRLRHQAELLRAAGLPVTRCASSSRRQGRPPPLPVYHQEIAHYVVETLRIHPSSDDVAKKGTHCKWP
ncbi:plasma membrane protein [Aureococcus anophagefferens]|uniref:ubiquitinyl hydrolase 1 n=1 Tax=Aureococcus anophagefferens TaxID=44056 RepID=A0ABR1G915_AURAN